jgi:hypothetical protein
LIDLLEIGVVAATRTIQIGTDKPAVEVYWKAGEQMVNHSKLGIHRDHRAGNSPDPLSGNRAVEEAAGEGDGPSTVRNDIDGWRSVPTSRTPDVGQGGTDVSPYVVASVALLSYGSVADSIRKVVGSIAGFVEVGNGVCLDSGKSEHCIVGCCSRNEEDNRC